MIHITTIFQKIHASQTAAGLEARASIAKLVARVREEIRCKDIFSKLKTVHLHPLHVFYPWTLRMGESTKQSELLLGTVLEIVIDNLSDYTWLYLLFTQMKQGCSKVQLFI